MKIEKHPTFKDNRGSFTPIDCNGWEQVNISVNDRKFTFRGMHYQTSPPQTKFIKVVKGSIIDILYNLETQECSFYILDENDALLVDKKFAHGFITLEPNTIVSYLVSLYQLKTLNLPYLSPWDTKYLLDTHTSINVVIRHVGRSGRLMKAPA